MSIVYTDKKGALHTLVLASASQVISVCTKLEKLGNEINEVFPS